MSARKRVLYCLELQSEVYEVTVEGTQDPWISCRPWNLKPETWGKRHRRPGEEKRETVNWSDFYFYQQSRLDTQSNPPAENT